MDKHSLRHFVTQRYCAFLTITIILLYLFTVNLVQKNFAFRTFMVKTIVPPLGGRRRGEQGAHTKKRPNYAGGRLSIIFVSTLR